MATFVLLLALLDTHIRDILFACWLATLILTVAAFFGRRRWIAAGRRDSAINLNAGTLLLARGVRREPETVELASIVETELKQDSRASTNKVRHWRVHLVVADSDKTRPVVDIRRKADAQLFEAWLRVRLALPVDLKADGTAS